MDSFEYLPWGVLALSSVAWVFITLFLGVALYLFPAFCLFTIAKKTNMENAWLAFIPFAQLVLMCQVAGKPWWWIFLFLIPIAQIVFYLIVCWQFAEARSKSGWVGILLIVPVAQFVAWALLAFQDR